MKAITIGLGLLCMMSFENSKAQGLFIGSPIHNRSVTWELGTMTLAQPINTGTFYTINRSDAGNYNIRTELHRQNGWMQRAYFRSNMAIHNNWLIYAMYDVAYQSYNYSSIEYYADGSLYRLNRYTGNDPSRSIQQALTLGIIYKQAVNDRLNWRFGGGTGLLMGIFEEEMPWLGGLLMPNFTGSLRLATQWEAGVEWQLSKKHDNLNFIAGYVFHHAFANNERIVTHYLATHHGLQCGLQFGLGSRRPAQRRSELIGY